MKKLKLPRFQDKISPKFVARYPNFKVKGLGIDMVSLTRIARLVDRYEDKIINLVFTAKELKYCRLTDDPYCAYAVCFGAKEAISKALTTGFADIDWDEIEVNPAKEKLTVCLYRQADTQAKKLGIQRWLLNWWKLESYVLVHAVAIGTVNR